MPVTHTDYEVGDVLQVRTRGGSEVPVVVLMKSDTVHRNQPGWEGRTVIGWDDDGPVIADPEIRGTTSWGYDSAVIEVVDRDHRDRYAGLAVRP